MKKIIPCVFITVAMMLAGSFLPALMLCPLPLAVLGCIEGRRNMSIAELMIEITLFLIVSPSLAVYFLIGCAPVSAVVFMLSQENFREAKKFTGGESYIICVGASIIFKTLLIVAFWFFTGKNILFPEAGQVADALSSVYGDNPELLAALQQVITVLPHIMPAMLIIYAGIEAYLNYSLCHKITRKFFPDNKNYPPELPRFTQWKFPVSIFIVSASAFILSWFVDTGEDFAVATFITNLQIVANVIMFVQGLSMAFRLMEGFKLRRGVKIALGVIMFVPFFWPWLIVMGMCDMVLTLKP